VLIGQYHRYRTRQHWHDGNK
ncbi:hypothetical protein D018_0911B, partial [Vibrio parahaemolyticus VP2007-007]